MRWGELKAYMLGASDDTEIVIWDAGDATWYELDQEYIVKATEDQKAVLVMGAGQGMDQDFELSKRTGIGTGNLVDD